MSLRLRNIPPGLRKHLPKDYAPEEGELVILDRKSLEAAAKKAAGHATGVKLVQAYTRLIGADGTSVKIDDLPAHLKGRARRVAGKEKTELSGAKLLEKIQSLKKPSVETCNALIELADILHEQMGKSCFADGLLTAAPRSTRASQAELSQWFAASVEEIRGAAGEKPVEVAGAERLANLAKQALLSHPFGLVVRAWFDQAVRDLHERPGLTDEAIGALQKFRTQTQPGRTSHARSDDGVLIRRKRELRREAELELLNPRQLSAVLGAIEHQRDQAIKDREKLLEIISGWDMKKSDLDSLVGYLIDYAPLTIQFHPDKTLPGGQKCIDSFLEDPRYKNQFETRISSGALAPSEGSSRDGWEKRLFKGAYHVGKFIPDERPKYGGLSPLNHPKGNGGDHYGKCFFELRHDVKFRSTFTPSDSAGCDQDKVTHLDVIERLLMFIYQGSSYSYSGAPSGAEYLKKMFKMAKGEAVSMTDRYPNSYIEAQIHGDVILERDVDFIVIDKSYITTPYGDKLLLLADKVGATPKLTDTTKIYLPD